MKYLMLILLCVGLIGFRVEADESDDVLLCPSDTLPEAEFIPLDLGVITYLYPSFGFDVSFSNASLVRLSNQGLQTISTPFSEEILMSQRRISPNGRFLAFLPSSLGNETNLGVWDILTNETSFLEMNDEELSFIWNYEWLSQQDDHMRFLWKDDETLVLRLTNPSTRSEEMTEIQFHVTGDPLTIQRLSPIHYVMPSILPIPSEDIWSVIPSPDGRYLAIFSIYDIPETLLSARLTIFDYQINDIVVDIIPSGEFKVFGQSPTWYGNYVYVVGRVINRQKLVRINLLDGSIDMSLHDRIQSFFTNEITISTVFMQPFLQNDVLVAQTGGQPSNNMPQSNYYILYDIPSDEVTLLCINDRIENSRLFMPFLTPDGDYVGQTDDNELFIIQTNSGETYKLPFHNVEWFLGWADPMCDRYIPQDDSNALMSAIVESQSVPDYVLCLDGGEYEVTETLPIISNNLTIYGRNATIHTSQPFDVSEVGNLTLNHVTVSE